MYELVLGKDAAKVVVKLSPKTKVRVLKALKAAQSDPFAGKRLHGELEGLLS